MFLQLSFIIKCRKMVAEYMSSTSNQWLSDAAGEEPILVKECQRQS